MPTPAAELSIGLLPLAANGPGSPAGSVKSRRSGEARMAEDVKPSPCNPMPDLKRLTCRGRLRHTGNRLALLWCTLQPFGNGEVMGRWKMRPGDMFEEGKSE